MQPGKEDQLAEESRGLSNASPGHLRTDVSHSTAQNTVTNPINSVDDPIAGGPSVGIEDSKFLMGSSLAQDSIAVPQDSRFTAGENSQELQNELTPLSVVREQDLMASPEQQLRTGQQVYQGQ